MSVSLNGLSTSKQDKLTAGTGISINGTTISCTVTAPSDYVKKDVKADSIGTFIIGSSTVTIDSKVTMSHKNVTVAGSSLASREGKVTQKGTNSHNSSAYASSHSGTWRYIENVGTTWTDTKDTATRIGIYQRIS